MSTTAPFSDLTTKCEAAVVSFLQSTCATTAAHMTDVKIIPGITGATFDYPAVICFAQGMNEAFYGTQFHWVAMNCQVITPRGEAATTANSDLHKLRVAEVEDALWSYNGNLRKGDYSALAAALTTAASNLNVIAIKPEEATSQSDDEQWTHNRGFGVLCEWVNTATT